MNYKTNRVKWSHSAKEIKEIREKVFVYEHRIPRTCEFDDKDQECEHVLLKNEDDITIATGRITNSGKISRIAVLMKFRQTDAAEKVIEQLLKIAHTKGLNKVFIDADLDSISYYKGQGFVPLGSVFMKAGVAKQRLACPVKQFNCQSSILH
jgi:predicted GNAT family N-acyltransferase